MTETRPEDYFAGCFALTPEEQSAARMVFAGLADDSQSSFRRGAARGPAQIRRAYAASCYNSTSESGVDLARAVFDAGDIPSPGDWHGTAAAFRAFVEKQIRAGQKPFLAGGDHAVSVPAIAALAALGAPVHVIQIDAIPTCTWNTKAAAPHTLAWPRACWKWSTWPASPSTAFAP
jgi:arginase family enzyme